MSKRKERSGCRFPILSLLGLIISVAGLYLAYDQWQQAQQDVENNRPDIVLCLRDFEYHSARSFTSDGEQMHVPAGSASFRLVNTGETDVTVTRVSFNPIGVWNNGRPGGLGSFDVDVSERIDGNGVATVNNISFETNIAIGDDTWFDVPEAVNVKANWAGGSGEWLTCIPSSFSGGWSCGDAFRNDQNRVVSVSVDAGCQ